MIRIIIADDHVVVRNGLAYLINEHDNMEVVGNAADGIEAYMMVEQLEPNIVVMDIRMPPGENGLLTTQRIKQNHSEVKVIILSMHDDEDYVIKALQSGADGYILKSSNDQEIINSIESVMDGEYYLDKQITLPSKFIDDMENGNSEHLDNSYNKLSNREQEILPLVALGYGNKEIAERLFISVKTVEAHKASFMKKLNLKNRVELIHYAVKEKIIDV